MLNFLANPQVGNEPPAMAITSLPPADATREVREGNGTSQGPHWTAKLDEDPAPCFSTHQQQCHSSRRRRNLLHRCSNSCCMKNSRSTRGSQSIRGAGPNGAMTYTNIPFERTDGTQTWPLRYVTSHNNTIRNYSAFYNLTWCPGNNSNLRGTSTTPHNLKTTEVPTSTAEITSPLLPQQQILPQIRRRAIEFMMARLQVRFSERDEAGRYEAIRQRIEKLENLVYNSAKTMDEYLHLVSLKLREIMDRLYSNYSSKITPVHPAENTSVNSTITSSVRPQSACV
ncbi:hypothetical protein SK128_025092 [Halocaridina rubra]|uniref:Uncharacterized protein n=1 Tax=Halocaridina rubra TaxID=373956 RepID=A0AAN9A9H5_HALRR